MSEPPSVSTPTGPQPYADLLPDELWLEIFSKLPVRALGQTAQVSRRFCTLAKADAVWKARCKEEYKVKSKDGWAFQHYYELYRDLLVPCGHILGYWRLVDHPRGRLVLVRMERGAINGYIYENVEGEGYDGSRTLCLRIDSVWEPEPMDQATSVAGTGAEGGQVRVRARYNPYGKIEEQGVEVRLEMGGMENMRRLAGEVPDSAGLLQFEHDDTGLPVCIIRPLNPPRAPSSSTFASTITNRLHAFLGVGVGADGEQELGLDSDDDEILLAGGFESLTLNHRRALCMVKVEGLMPGLRKGKEHLMRHPLEGMWVGDYGGHGREIIAVHLPEGSDEVVGLKVTGDANVPAGRFSLRLSSTEHFTSAAIPGFNQGPSQILSYTGRGRIALTGYRHPSFSPVSFITSVDNSRVAVASWEALLSASRFYRDDSFSEPLIDN